MFGRKQGNYSKVYYDNLSFRNGITYQRVGVILLVRGVFNPDFRIVDDTDSASDADKTSC